MLTITKRPARTANLARNLLADAGREQRWRPARDAFWTVLDRHKRDGARVAIVGAGNGHDVPLTRLLARAGSVDLIDLCSRPSRRALRREPAALRRRGRALRRDVTGGVADPIALGRSASDVATREGPGSAARRL